MPFFQAKARTAEEYLAGIGISGALMGSASVLFVILIGLVTFNAWPLDGGLVRGGGGQVPVANNQASPATVARRGPFTSETRLAGAAGRQPAGLRRGGAPAGDGGLPTGDGGSGSGLGGEAPAIQPPPPSGPAQPRNAISQTLSDAGTTVESGTDSLGDALGGSNGSGLGGVVGAAGRTLNDDLQSLADSP